MTLRYKEEEPIDVVEWCSTSVLAHEESRASLARESGRVAKLEKEVENLQSQLNEFIEAKKADEAGLMEKFRDLLNEKKVKIREQHRLLASAPRARSPQEKDVVATEGRSPDIKIEEDARGHKPAPSRRSKRKTVTPREESSDDEFEKMEVDAQRQAQAQDSEGDGDRTTSAGSDQDVTASEDEDEESPTTREAASQSTNEVKKNEAPPPKRELPFATKRSAKTAPPPKAAESETESDDEL